MKPLVDIECARIDTSIEVSMTSDNGPRPRDLGGLGQDLQRVADNLQRTGQQLRDATQAAADLSFEVNTPDGLVRVTASGNRRLTSIDLTTRLMERDANSLGTTVMAAINEVLGQARLGSQAALMNGLPMELRDDVERVVDQARLEMNP
jgi:DNA-binding protein YbaB